MYPAQILVIVYSDKETYLGPPSSCLKLMMSGFPIFCTLFFWDGWTDSCGNSWRKPT